MPCRPPGLPEPGRVPSCSRGRVRACGTPVGQHRRGVLSHVSASAATSSPRTAAPPHPHPPWSAPRLPLAHPREAVLFRQCVPRRVSRSPPPGMGACRPKAASKIAPTSWPRALISWAVSRVHVRRARVRVDDQHAVLERDVAQAFATYQPPATSRRSACRSTASLGLPRRGTTDCRMGRCAPRWRRRSRRSP